MALRALVDCACLSCPNGTLIENIALYATSDKHGVHITIDGGSRSWELNVDTDAARQLVFRLHAAVLDAIRADHDPAARRNAHHG